MFLSFIIPVRVFLLIAARRPSEHRSMICSSSLVECLPKCQVNKKQAVVAFIALLTCALAGQALVSIRLTSATALFRRILL